MELWSHFVAIRSCVGMLDAKEARKPQAGPYIYHCMTHAPHVEVRGGGEEMALGVLFDCVSAVTFCCWILLNTSLPPPKGARFQRCTYYLRCRNRRTCILAITLYQFNSLASRGQSPSRCNNHQGGSGSTNVACGGEEVSCGLDGQDIDLFDYMRKGLEHKFCVLTL
jgi:hypothetical protein